MQEYIEFENVGKTYSVGEVKIRALNEASFSIKPDGICFDSRIAWYSYILGFILTLIFAELVKIVMCRKLKKIQMAESLKSVE